MKKYKILAFFYFFICEPLDNTSKDVKSDSRMPASDYKIVENT
jgi:hypothetical protein